MADNIGLTTDETIGIFYRYQHLLRPRRRLVFHLIELHDHTHEELVARRHMTTVDASRSELKRARHDLRRIAETQGELDRILIARELAALPVYVREHSPRRFED